ncbi:LRR domain containing protein [Trema orientale]|uniref:LRR domain containing protein n=1 Tax=Trema orientale TaxID=63057 RepID=A0A2P5EDK9_TREOI|nr:LRR domain containing protein [Trema orientale]
MRTDEELASGKIFGLRTLFLGGCVELEYVPYNWFYDLSSLETLLLDGCWKFEHFQTRLLCLYSLTQLHLRCCNVLEIPDWLGLLSSLTELHLGGNPFGSIPSTIKQLRQLTTLELRNCINLRSLPELPFSMRFLNASGCTSLETLSNSGDARAVQRNQMQADVHKFLFCNCLKLNQSARDNFTDILCAVALMQGYPKFIAYCPGNNISNWFNYQSEGSSLTFKLPSNNWPPSNNFLGFATCFVVASEATYSDPYQCLTVECDLHLKTIHGQILEELDNFLGWNFTTVDFVDDVGSKIVSSDHVFISFSGYEADETSNKKMFGSYFDGIEASFRFQAFIDGWQNDHMDFEIKRCGVRMLYSEEPNQELSVTTDEYGLDTIDYSRPNNRGTSTSHAIIDFDVHQPHPKRSRIF